MCIYCSLIIFWSKIDFSFIADIQQIRIKQLPVEYSVELGYVQYFIWVSSSGDRNFRSLKPLLPTAIWNHHTNGRIPQGSCPNLITFQSPITECFDWFYILSCQKSSKIGYCGNVFYFLFWSFSLNTVSFTYGSVSHILKH